MRKASPGSVMMTAVFVVASIVLASSASAQGEVMYVVNDKVGIGTASPFAVFDVVAPGNLGMFQAYQDGPGGAAFSFRKARGTSGSPSAVVANDVVGGFTAIGRANTVWANVASFRAYVDSGGTISDGSMPGRLEFQTTPNGSNQLQTRMVIKNNGYVGIGEPAPSHLLHLGGGAYSDGGTWVDGSSREYKDDIQDLDASAAADAVMSLNPVTFRYRETGGTERVGFIAEDVPDLVATDDRKGVAAMDVVAVLTKVVQQQQETIKSLEARLAALENQK